MSFPSNFDELQVLATQKQDASVVARMGTLEHQLVLLKTGATQHKEIAEILQKLITSWREPDLGKYGDVYFFLTGDMKRAVVRELLPSGTLCETEQEWKDYMKTRTDAWPQIWHDSNYERVPYYYPAITLQQASKKACPKCGQEQPLIEHYAQTYDSPEGDQWLKRYLILCIDCRLVAVHVSRSANHRF